MGGQEAQQSPKESNKVIGMGVFQLSNFHYSFKNYKEGMEALEECLNEYKESNSHENNENKIRSIFWLFFYFQKIFPLNFSNSSFSGSNFTRISEIFIQFYQFNFSYLRDSNSNFAFDNISGNNNFNENSFLFNFHSSYYAFYSSIHLLNNLLNKSISSSSPFWSSLSLIHLSNFNLFSASLPVSCLFYFIYFIIIFY